MVRSSDGRYPVNTGIFSHSLPVDLGGTLVCQSDPTWYKSDPTSTSSRRILPETTCGDLGQKQPTFDFKSTSYMALCCLPSFIMIYRRDSSSLTVNINVKVVISPT